jgi:hypothetical protein
MQKINKLYTNYLKNRIFGLFKASGLNDRKQIHISNIDSLTIVQSRELLIKPKTDFSGSLCISHFLLLFLLAALFFAIPIEHKYDKLFRFYSLTLVPSGLELGDFDPKIYFYISDLIALVFLGWGIWRIRLRLAERGGLFLAIVFGSSLCSLLLSPFAHFPVAYIRLLQLLTPVSLFMFLANSPFPKERLFKIGVWSLFWTGLMQAFLATWQYFSQHSLGLRLLGEQPLNTGIFVPDGHRWVLDQWFHRIGETMIYRAMGTMPHPNPMGGLFALTLLITSYLFFTHPNIRKWLAPAYLIQLFGLAITYSRSALFAYVIGTIVWFSWMRWRQQILMKSTAMLILISGAIVGTLLHEQILQRGGVVNYTSLSRASDHVRFYYQKLAFRMIEKHPLAGVGFGQFSLRTPSFLPKGQDPMPASTTIVHNVYLVLAAETGLISLAAFLGWIGLILWAAWRSSPSLPETGLLLGAFIGFLFIGCCDFYPVFFQQGKLMFFGTAGLLARFGCFARKKALAAEPCPSQPL